MKASRFFSILSVSSLLLLIQGALCSLSANSPHYSSYPIHSDRDAAHPHFDTSISQHRRHQTSLVHDTVLLRGGATSPLLMDPKTAAKAMTIAAGVQGLVMNTGPKWSNELYGFSVQDNDEFAQYWAGMVGAGIFSYAILLYFMLFKGTSLAVANQAAYAFWIYQNVRMMLSGTLDSLTDNLNGAMFSVVVFVAACHAMTNSTYSKSAIKALGIFWSITGLQDILFPDSAADAWQFNKEKLTDATGFLIGLFGYFLLAFSAFNISIVHFDMTPVQATGCGSIVWGLFHLVGLVKGDFKQLGLHQGSQFFWLLFHVIVAAITLT